MAKVGVGLSRRIALLSFIAACVVVCIHIPYGVGLGLDYVLPYFIVRGLGSVAVPYFFFVSGYFLAAHVGESRWWASALKKRCITLLVPYVLWCLIPMIFCFAVQILAALVHGRSPFDSLPLASPFVVFGLDLNRPILFAWQLWYLRALLICVLVSPVLAYAIRNVKAGLGALYILCVLSDVFATLGTRFHNLFHFAVSFHGMLFFAMGMYWRINNVRVSAGLAKVLLLGALAIFAALAFAASFFSWVPSQLVRAFTTVPLVVACIVGAWHCAPEVELPQILALAAFPIYVLHVMFLIPGQLLFKYTAPGWITVKLLLGALIDIGLCIAVAWLLMRIAPRCAGMLFGGRVR